MKNEISVLLSLDKTRMSSQREIAKAAGISLGNANLAINNLIKKGLLKRDQTEGKDIYYDLTQEGENERDNVVINKANESIQWFYRWQRNIDEVIQKNNIKKEEIIILYGEDDWLRVLISENLSGKKIGWKFIKEYTIEKLESSKVIVWSPNYKRVAEKNTLDYIYLLDSIEI